MTNNNSDDILTVDFSTTQSTGYCNDDSESSYEWKDYLCILLKNGEYITIDDVNMVELKKPDKLFGQRFEKRFFKLRVGVIPGTMWTKTLDYDVEDYQKILSNDFIIKVLESLHVAYPNSTLRPNPTYISEMKAELRELQINRIV